MRSTVEYMIATILMILCVACGGDYQSEAPTVSSDSPEGFIRLVDTIFRVGEPVHVGLQGAGCLLVTSSWHERFLCPEGDQRASFQLPETFNQTAGKLHLALYEGGRLLDRRIIAVVAGQPYRKLAGYLGPKTISVDRGEIAQLIAIPTDRYYNLCEDSTMIEVTQVSLESSQNTSYLSTESGVAYAYFEPMTRAGEVRIGAKTGTAAMRSKTLLYTPGIPGRIRVYKAEGQTFTGEQRETTVVTEPMTDRFGNRVTDGLHMDFVVTGARGGTSIIQATTANGVASAVIPNPDLGGEITVLARVPGGTTSNTLAINFLPEITDFIVSLDPGNEWLKIGPVVNTLRSLVADGTEVELAFTIDGEKRVRKFELINGMLDLFLASIPGLYENGGCDVTISSITKEIRWKQ